MGDRLWRDLRRGEGEGYTWREGYKTWKETGGGGGGSTWREGKQYERGVGGLQHTRSSWVNRPPGDAPLWRSPVSEILVGSLRGEHLFNHCL